MKLASFFTELKRRNVYKVAVAYAVVAWLLVQAASILLPTFEAPAWVMKAFVVFLAIGFVVSVIISWAFEATPEGLTRTENVSLDLAAALPSWSRRKFGVFISIVALVAAGLLAFQILRTRSPSQPQSRQATTTAPPISEKSIAVLPFENLSDEKTNAYFAAGIEDEILTRLSKIGALKVISRTSTNHYASSPQNLPEIAKQLGVANILEGSVQKVSDAVRINVQLIRATTDDHLWAESYDRKLNDIFGVEAEVAQSIASALNAKLTGAEQQMLAQIPTNNPAAYDAYLRGSARIRTIDPETARAAVQSFEEAVRLDPQFALAWAYLSKAHSLLFFSAEATQAHRAAAEKALAEAMRLQPQLAETQLARAYFQYWVLHDKQSARDVLLQLRAIWPNNAEIPEALGYISARLGDWSGSLNYFDQALALSPRDHFLRFGLVDMQIATRDFTGALKMLNEGLQIWPNDVEFLGLKAGVFQSLGRLNDAQSIVNGLNPADQDQSAIGALWHQARLQRDPAPLLPFFRSLARRAEKSDAYWSLWNRLAYARLEEQAGDKAEAGASFAAIRARAQEALKEQPDNERILRRVAVAFAGLGERDAALQALDRASTVTKDDAREHPNVEEVRARILVRFGAKDEAIAILEKLLTTSYDGPLTPALLRLDPDFDPLRGDPRFEKLCEEKKP